MAEGGGGQDGGHGYAWLVWQAAASLGGPAGAGSASGRSGLPTAALLRHRHLPHAMRAHPHPHPHSRPRLPRARSEDARHAVSYELAWRRLSDPTRLASRAVQQQLGDQLKSAIRHIMRANTLDNPHYPTSGGWVGCFVYVCGWFCVCVGGGGGDCAGAAAGKGRANGMLGSASYLAQGCSAVALAPTSSLPKARRRAECNRRREQGASSARCATAGYGLRCTTEVAGLGPDSNLLRFVKSHVMGQVRPPAEAALRPPAALSLRRTVCCTSG